MAVLEAGSWNHFARPLGGSCVALLGVLNAVTHDGAARLVRTTVWVVLLAVSLLATYRAYRAGPPDPEDA
jgi:hypothetical protein